MTLSANNKTKPGFSIAKPFNAALNFAIGPFFAPLGFSAAGLIAGGFLAADYGFSIVSAMIFGAISGLVIWFLIIVAGWFS